MCAPVVCFFLSVSSSLPSLDVCFLSDSYKKATDSFKKAKEKTEKEQRQQRERGGKMQTGAAAREKTESLYWTRLIRKLKEKDV